MSVGDFQDLVVWQKAVTLARASYGLARRLPIEERFELASQLRRASAGVSINIAEGHTSPYRRDFLRYLRMAHCSTKEVASVLLLCVAVGYFPRADAECALALADEVSRMLRAMRHGLGEPMPRDRARPPWRTP